MAVHRRKTVQTGEKGSAEAQKAEPMGENARFVTEVVEVVEEPQKEEALETIKKDAEEIERAASELEVTSPASMPQEKNLQEEKPEETNTNKEIVEELFQKGSSQVPSEITFDKNGSGKNIFAWALIVIIVALVVGGGLIFAVKGTKGISSFITKPTPTPTPAPTPTPTPATEAIDKTSFTIQVLNGGGTPGAAVKMKSFLEEKGYKVGNVGNTDNYTYDKTELHGKSAMQGALANLKADLANSYTVGTVAADLSSGSSYDVQVIVGKE